MKNRKQKQSEYEKQFSGIPLDYAERIAYMYDLYNFDKRPKAVQDLLQKRENMLSNLYYYDLDVVSLYEIPEGTARPRFRLVNRKNFHNEAIANSSFVHVYTPNAHDDFLHMRRLMNDELVLLDHMINTPVNIEYSAYFKTPTEFSDIDKCLCEVGIIRPSAKKPDFDNIEKKYADMYNHNIWVDDSTVNDATIHKFYSILPRVEIKIRYLNCLYNRSQFNNIVKRAEYDGSPLAYLNTKGDITYEQ